MENVVEDYKYAMDLEGTRTVRLEVDTGTTTVVKDSEGKEVLGENCRRFRDFPILVKFIDAKDNLSIQVHPDNNYALKERRAVW